ncbi:putative leader peptide [Nonomuraea helvata]
MARLRACPALYRRSRARKHARHGTGQSHTLDPVLDIRDGPSIFIGMPADPMLVGRRHVDLQRVRSAICCDARM